MSAQASAASKLGSNIPPLTQKKSEWVKIILSDDLKIPPTGQFFGINRRNYILRAGEEARVPKNWPVGGIFRSSLSMILTHSDFF